MSTNTPQTPPSSSFAPARRQFIFGTAVLATFGVAGFVGGMSARHSAWAQGSTVSDADFAAFMHLSQYLTGKTTLDVEIARAIFAGLHDEDANVATQVAQINDFVARSKTPANALQAALDSTQPALAGLPKRIMPAWYLGVVGSGKKARTVAYEQALMYPPIADVIVMPSYARGAPGYWAQPPHLSHS
ncbi:sugar dehydrogenase complex small subunit [Caballeronia sp. S22]|uniref:sugar dehydrogenase complex small subunit n=1 Tax=Caballeronia sp. S22 TaxID=3137182 RepID=UPI003530E3E9